MNRLSRQTVARFIPVAKLVVGIIVAIGLFVAARSAMDQWKEQTAAVVERLRQLDDQIEGAEPEELRQQLRILREETAASLPVIGNLKWRRIGLAGLFYGIGLVPSAFVLRSALTTLGESANRSTCIASQLLGHAGKYVPGKAMVIVLRAGGLAKDGVGLMRATVAVFMETFLNMAVGASLAGIIVVLLRVEVWLMVVAALVAVAASIPTFPPVLRRVVARVSSSTDQGDDRQSLTHGQSVKFFYVGWAWSILTWGLMGTAFTMLITAIPSTVPLQEGIHLWAIATAAITLAMVVGFASLIPGGAGVRELVLTTLLATTIGSSHALLAAVAARLVFLVVESVLAFASWLWLRRVGKSAESDD